MIKHWCYCFMLMMLAVVTGCTTEGPDTDEIVFRVAALFTVCSPEVDGDIRDCTSALLPFGEVTIRSGSEVIWEGELQLDGEVEARFSTSRDFVVTVTSPFMPEELRSDPIPPDTTMTGVELHAQDLYLLTPLDSSGESTG